MTAASHHYEFGGPIGAAAVVILLPYVIFALFFLCNQDTCVTFTNIFDYDWPSFLRQLLHAQDYITAFGFTVFIGWFLFQFFLERFLPGEIAEGSVLPGTTDTRLKYTMNGHLAFWLSLIAMGHAIPLVVQTSPDVWALKGLRPLPLDLVHTHYVELIAASIAFSAVLSVYLYVSSFVPNKILAKGGNTGNAIYDFFIGRELNPRLTIPGCSITWDLKCFCELRPGLIGWTVIDIAMAFAQYKKLGYISGSMLLVVLFQGKRRSDTPPSFKVK